MHDMNNPSDFFLKETFESRTDRILITSLVLITVLFFSLVGIASASVITITTIGDHTYTIGEVITISGANDVSDTTYLFLTGPGLDENGVVLTNFYQKTVNRQFTEVDVETDWTWQYRWNTASVADNLLPGEYVLYATYTPKSKSALSPAEFSSQSITFVITSEEPAAQTPGVTSVPATTTTSSGDLYPIRRVTDFVELGPFVSGEENVIWSNQYGKNDPELDYAMYTSYYSRNILETSDMGIILTGLTFYNNYETGINLMEDTKSFIIKLSSEGHILWAYEIDSSNIITLVSEADNDDIWIVTSQENLIIMGKDGTIKSQSLIGDWKDTTSLDLHTRSGGGYRLVGTSVWTYPDLGYDLWYVDYNANGQVIGSKRFEKIFDNNPVVMIQTASGDVISCISTDTMGGSHKLMKIDTDGNIKWERIVEIGGTNNICRIILLSNGDYIAMGDATVIETGCDWDLWLFRFNEDGDILWSNLYGTDNSHVWDLPSDIEELSTGHLLVGGCVNNGVSWPVNQSWSELSLWVFDQDGVLLDQIRSTDSPAARGILETRDGDILISGHRQSNSFLDHAPFGLIKMSLDTTGLTPAATATAKTGTQQHGGSGNTGFIMNIPGYTACTSLIALLTFMAAYSARRRIR